MTDKELREMRKFVVRNDAQFDQQSLEDLERMLEVQQAICVAVERAAENSLALLHAQHHLWLSCRYYLERLELVR